MNTIIGTKALAAKPSSVIRSDYNAFSAMCHEMDEPILITRNGESDLVVMSHHTYNDMISRMKLTIDLMEADRDLANTPTISAKEVFAELRGMINEQIHG